MKLKEISKLCVDATTAVIDSIELMWSDFEDAISKAHSVYSI